jgi:hypothetical protein
LSRYLWEKGGRKRGLWGLFSAPFPPRAPTRAPGRFNLFLGFSRPSVQGFEPLPRELLLTFSTSFITLPHPPPLPLQRVLFWLLELCSRNGLLSTYPAGHGSRYIWDPVPDRSSSLPPSSSSLSNLKLRLSFQPDPRFKS